ncbi:MAG: FliG C-terminal domain-containing protein [Elusimicrobiales bacterium]|nr:FliG C-terminal domain-containing protein [Elusimicrobiales bacterium]
MIRYILMVSILAVQAAAAPLLSAQTASRSSLEGKLALESSLEKRVRMVLSEALGTEDIIVIISAELQEQDKKSAEIMPGVPQKEKMGEPSLSSSLTMVKKISASLILDKALSEPDTELARKLALGLLGLPPDRQDLVTIEKMDFRKTKPLTMATLFAPPNLWSLIWILVVGVLAMVTVTVFLSPLSKSARAFVEAFSANSAAAAAGGDRPDRPEAEAARPEAAAAAEAAAKDIEGRKPPFWFLNAGHLGSLAFIMKNRPVEDLTIVLSYAPGDFAAKLAEALYPRSAEAMAALPKVTLMPEARIRALEAEILSSLDYVVGGEEKAITVISGLDEAVQDKALAALSKVDPAMSRKLGALIIRLSHIQNIESSQAQALARRVSMRVLAAALKGSAYAKPFTAKLAGGMQERFQQELDLTRDLPAEAYKADRAKVVEAMRQMLKEGLLTLKPHGAPSLLPAGAKPGAAPAAGKHPAGAAPSPAAAAKPAAAAPGAKAPLPAAKP